MKVFFAGRRGHGTEEYVRELVERYLDEDSVFREAARKGFAALDGGDFIEEDEVNFRVERILRSWCAFARRSTPQTTWSASASAFGSRSRKLPAR